MGLGLVEVSSMREGVSDDSRANIDLCVSGSVELMGTGDDLMKQTAVNHGVVSAKVVRVVFRSPDSSYVVECSNSGTDRSAI